MYSKVLKWFQVLSEDSSCLCLVKSRNSRHPPNAKWIRVAHMSWPSLSSSTEDLFFDQSSSCSIQTVYLQTLARALCNPSSTKLGLPLGLEEIIINNLHCSWMFSLTMFEQSSLHNQVLLSQSRTLRMGSQLACH